MSKTSCLIRKYSTLYMQNSLSGTSELFAKLCHKSFSFLQLWNLAMDEHIDNCPVSPKWYQNFSSNSILISVLRQSHPCHLRFNIPAHQSFYHNTLGSRYRAGPDNETPQVKFVIGPYSLSGQKWKKQQNSFFSAPMIARAILRVVLNSTRLDQYYYAFAVSLLLFN